MPIKELLKPIGLNYVGKKEVSPYVYCFNFMPERPLKWEAGQHGIIAIKKDPTSKKTIKRSFSITSAPDENIISIITRIPKDKADNFKTQLMALKKGDAANLRGPIGNMRIRGLDQNYAFLATGLSIAPFRSILKQLALSGGADTKITLFYVGSRDNHIFKDELSEFKLTLKNLSIEYIYKPDRITGQFVEDILGEELYNTTFFLSGPPKTIKGYRRTLLGLGVAKNNIIRSRYLDYRSRLAIMLPLKNRQPVNIDI
jgi:ferredoxin-NADP reductase